MSDDQPCLNSRIYAPSPSRKIPKNILGEAPLWRCPSQIFYVWEMPQIYDYQFLGGLAGGLDF